MAPPRRRLAALIVALVAAIVLLVASRVLDRPPEEPLMEDVPPPQPSAAPVAGSGATLVPVFAIHGTPVDIQRADGVDAMFVVAKHGIIHVAGADGTVRDAPLLDIRDRVRSREAERGLLGLAFAPDFASSGMFYVNYSGHDGQTVVARFTAAPATLAADSGTEQVLLTIPQPFANHNGGQVRFGPDGMLWIATGDGGSQGDPHGNAQNPASMLGKLLRIDVAPARRPADAPYAIPAGNRPAVSPGERPEIWAYGLRNPWRFAFDSGGDLFVADVGGSKWEEISIVAASLTGGVDFGWDRLEGRACHEPDSGCEPGGAVAPVHVYGHGRGRCSITGGVHVADDTAGLAGAYVFSDYCGGWVSALVRDAGAPADDATSAGWRVLPLVPEAGLHVSTFGTAPDGAIHVADMSGWIYRLELAAVPPDGSARGSGG